MANRLAVTGVCLVLYLAAPFLPLPGLDLEGLGTLPIYSLGRASVFALDLYPFLRAARSPTGCRPSLKGSSHSPWPTGCWGS